MERLKTPRSNRFFLAEEEPRRDTGYIKDGTGTRSPLYYLLSWTRGGAGRGKKEEEEEKEDVCPRVFSLWCCQLILNFFVSGLLEQGLV